MSIDEGIQAVRSEKVQLIKNSLSSTGNARRIVIAVNETPESINGLRWTLDHIVDCKKDLVLILTVTNTVPKQFQEFRRVSGSKSLEDLSLAHFDDNPIFSEVAKLVQAYDRDNGSQLECLYCTVFNSDTVTGIVQFCKDMNANLLTIGKRVLGTMQKLVTPSVSKRMMNQAPCSVIVIGKDDHVEISEKTGEIRSITEE